MIGLLNGGTDSVNAVKQAAEFGVTRSGAQQIAAVAMLINDVKALGLPSAQGLAGDGVVLLGLGRTYPRLVFRFRS